MNAPPWIHTITGSELSTDGVAMVSVRQSSSWGWVAEITSASGPSSGSTACGQIGPSSVASRVPSQGAGGCGGANRRSPTGGAANGTPLKWWIPSFS